MKNICLLTIGALLCCAPYPIFPANNSGLQTGDLLFQEGCSGNMTDAIKGVTSGANGYNFTHVGMVWIHNTDTFVIEATHPCVAITPIGEYLHPADKACPPISVAARLKEEFRPLIPKAIEEALKLVGKKYDDGFVLNNDQYYCSELIYDILLKANDNQPVFQLNVMTFKAKNSDEFLPEWVSYYKKLGIPIPEGKWGINPGAMSRSEVLEMMEN
jgi:hypothetical protein